MDKPIKIAFIGGGNMAWALASGLSGQVCSPDQIQVVEIDETTRKRWDNAGMSSHAAAGESLSTASIWIYAVKPQVMSDVVAQTRPFLADDTLVVSVAAGVRSDTLSRWLGTAGQPWPRVVRCMPNTPALVGAGACGLAALPQVSQGDCDRVSAIFATVGEVVWVDGDAGLDAVTALSGSGPAYVFLLLESLIAAAEQLGLPHDAAHRLALATVAGATRLASESTDSPGTLRGKVTSKGGTTAAALAVFQQAGFGDVVEHAMQAAFDRSRELGDQADA